jgi:eukaryotic-like serine/threonine-protein kinase
MPGDVANRAFEVLEQALDRPEEARLAWLHLTYGDDPDLVATVKRMLEQERRAALAFPTLGGPALAPEEPAPQRIGRYRIVRRLGEGGMGSVYLGARDDGLFDHEVAIKIVRHSLFPEAALSLFQKERQALAQLTHKGIAQLFDGGVSADGSPYLIMEYVRGDIIDEHVTRRDLAPLAIVDLLAGVCEATQYAHQNFIVHADIKPSNIIVTKAGEPKIVDFGVANILTESSLSDQPVDLPRTPGYASPRRLAGEPPTPSDDVYSLGVLLCTLLTGRLPSDPSDVPSSLVMTSTAFSNRSQAWRTRRMRQIRGDLDSIIQAATAKDVRHRYPDVTTLLADLRRYRERRPVSVRSNSRTYRFSKYVSRHPVGAAAAILLSTATAVSTTLYVKAERARQEADQRFFDVRDLSHFMLFGLYDRLANAPGTVDARAQLADTARIYLDRLRQLPDAPEDLRLDAIRGYRRLAQVQGLAGVASLGRPAEANQSLDIAEAMARQLINERPDNADAYAELGLILNGRWTLQAENAQSETINRASHDAFVKALDLNPNQTSAQLGLLSTERNRGFDLYWTEDKPQEALGVYRKTLSDLKEIRLNPDDYQDGRILEVHLLNRIGDVLYDQSDIEGALQTYREAEAITRQELAKEDSLLWLDRLGETLYNVSGTLADMPGRQTEALATAREGVAAMRRVLSFGYDASAEKRLSILLGQEANVLATMGKHAEAVETNAESLAIRERRVQAAPLDAMRNRDLAIGLNTHTDILTAAGMKAEACSTARRAVAQWDSIKAQGRLGNRDARKNMPDAVQNVAHLCP